MSELYHYGRPNQKWGIRNYQNRDGTWTELGKKRRRIGGGQRQQAKISKWVDDAGDSVTDAVKTGAKKVVGDLRNFARGTGKDTADAIKLGAKTVHDDAAKAFPNATATVDQTAANAKESVKETAGQMRLKETAKNALDSLKSVPDQIDDATARVRYKDVGNKFKKVFDSAYSPDTSDEDFKRITKALDSDPEIEKTLIPIKKEAIRIQDTMYRKYSDDFNSKEARQEYNDMMKNLQNQIRETGKKLGLDTEDPEYEDFYENHVGDRILDWTGNFSMASYIYHSDPTPDTAALIHSGTLILGDSSSYLEHYGRPGQKWGVRNYQNPDGSLTPLGYIHYGYGKAKKAAGGVAKATAKGVTGTAKTLHKIGKHTAVSIKNVSDKHKAKVLAKKKAKASQSREGVLKNKKLFTTDELRTLGERFDQEDKLKLKESAESMFDYDSKRLAKKKEKAAQSREGVLKNKQLFTTEELAALSRRFDIEDDISLGKVRKGAEIVGKVAENAEKVAKAVKAGGEAYNVLTGKAPLKDKGKDKNKDKDKDGRDKEDDKGSNKDNSKSNMVDEAESRKMFTEDDYGRTIDYNPRPASRSSSGSLDATRSSTRRDDSSSWASSPDSSHGPSPDFSEPTSTRNTSNSSYRPRASAEDLARGEAMIRNDIRNAMARASETRSSGSNSAYDEHLNQVINLLEAQKRGEVPIEYHSYAIDNDPMFQTQDPTYTYRRKKATHSAIEGTTLILGDNSAYLAHYGRKGMKWYQHIFAKAVGNRDSRGRLTEKGKRKLAKKITKKKSKKKIYEGAREAIESKKRLHKNVHTAVGATSGAIIAGSISAVLGASAVVAAPAVAGGALIVGGIGRGLSALESNTSSASYKRKIKKVDKQINKLEKKLADG